MFPRVLLDKTIGEATEFKLLLFPKAVGATLAGILAAAFAAVIGEAYEVVDKSGETIRGDGVADLLNTAIPAVGVGTGVGTGTGTGTDTGTDDTDTGIGVGTDADAGTDADTDAGTGVTTVDL